MSDIRVMFTIDDSTLSNVLQVMAPYAIGPAVVGLHAFDEPERKARDLFMGRPAAASGTPAEVTPEGEAPARGKAPNGQSRVVMSAVDVIREAGGKGLAAGAVHTAMIGRGIPKQQSYNAVYVGIQRGYIRRAKNGRLFVTRQGNALA